MVSFVEARPTAYWIFWNGAVSVPAALSLPVGETNHSAAKTAIGRNAPAKTATVNLAKHR